MPKPPTVPGLQDRLPAERLAFAAQVLKLIAHPGKLAILQHLYLQGETSVNDLVRVVGLSQPLISHHLANLKEGGVVACRREGQSMLYRLELYEVSSVLECMAHCRIPNPNGTVTPD
ncbi:MAG: metalloregulator ArsR/SmtB family transcription factor [Bacteroidia bacterium]|nr:metalloregulator ArsR/SmtB family transcription factor [Bacteroidia bacterium]